MKWRTAVGPRARAGKATLFKVDTNLSRIRTLSPIH
jgi:hypothetical protein